MLQSPKRFELSHSGPQNSDPIADEWQIDIKDLSVSIGGKELLDHAELRVKDGGHYVFVGRNGTGKSSMPMDTVIAAEQRLMSLTSSLEGPCRGSCSWNCLEYADALARPDHQGYEYP